MNDTKWREIFWAFFDEERKSGGIYTRWRKKDKISGDISEWDATWTHFGAHPPEYHRVEWLKIQLDDVTRDFVLNTLIKIHVPAEVSENEVTVYGYRTDVDYLS